MLLAVTGLLAAGAAALAVATDHPSPAYQLVQAADATLGARGFAALIASRRAGDRVGGAGVSRVLYEAPDRALEALSLPGSAGRGDRTLVVTAIGSSATWSPGGLPARGVDFAVLGSQFLGPLYAIDGATDVRGSGDHYRFVLPSLTVRTVGWLTFTGDARLPAGVHVVTRRFRDVRVDALVHNGAVTGLAMLLKRPAGGSGGAVVVVVRYRDLGDAPPVPGPSP